jgi:hypothetical protein
MYTYNYPELDKKKQNAVLAQFELKNLQYLFNEIIKKNQILFSFPLTTVVNFI